MLAATQNASVDCPTINGGTGEGVTVRHLLEHLSQALLKQKVELVFSGVHRAGDPTNISPTCARTELGLAPKRHWQDGVKEYAAWWRQSAEKARWCPQNKNSGMKIGFVFEDNLWQAVSYLRNLLAAIRAVPGEDMTPIVFTGMHAGNPSGQFWELE